MGIFSAYFRVKFDIFHLRSVFKADLGKESSIVGLPLRVPAPVIHDLIFKVIPMENNLKLLQIDTISLPVCI